jgi:altronate dehydratase large subunit
MNTEVLGYRRDNGTVGIRDYLLALPSVVCANEAAALAVRGRPDGVTIEHPVGCAQIGADKEQTWRTLVGVGAHPNVRQTVVVSLGCEGIVAATIEEGIRAQGRATAVFGIQATGGVVEAGHEAGRYLDQFRDAGVRAEPLPLEQLVLGIADIRALGQAGEEIVRAYRRLGGRTLMAAPPDMKPPAGVSLLEYAEPLPPHSESSAMRTGAGDGETITGLAASGAHLILAAGDLRHLGGHAIVPVVRVGHDPNTALALTDDLDGQAGDRSPEAWVAFLLEVANGRRTASEVLGSQIFAIQRIGPTM